MTNIITTTLSSSDKLIKRVARLAEKHGYYFFVSGWIPKEKDPKKTDEKLIRQYEIARSRIELLRDFRQGRAKLRLCRFGHFFVLLATEGSHPFFEEEKPKDLRLNPLRYNGYVIRLQGGRVRVRWSEETYRKLRRGFLKAALNDREKLEKTLAGIKHLNYSDLHRQKEKIVRATGLKRRKAGVPPLGSVSKRM